MAHSRIALRVFTAPAVFIAPTFGIHLPEAEQVLVALEKVWRWRSREVLGSGQALEVEWCQAYPGC